MFVILYSAEGTAGEAGTVVKSALEVLPLQDAKTLLVAQWPHCGQGSVR